MSATDHPLEILLLQQHSDMSLTVKRRGDESGMKAAKPSGQIRGIKHYPPAGTFVTRPPIAIPHIRNWHSPSRPETDTGSWRQELNPQPQPPASQYAVMFLFSVLWCPPLFALRFRGNEVGKGKPEKSRRRKEETLLLKKEKRKAKKMDLAGRHQKEERSTKEKKKGKKKIGETATNNKLEGFPRIPPPPPSLNRPKACWAVH